MRSHLVPGPEQREMTHVHAQHTCSTSQHKITMLSPYARKLSRRLSSRLPLRPHAERVTCHAFAATRHHTTLQQAAAYMCSAGANHPHTAHALDTRARPRPSPWWLLACERVMIGAGGHCCDMQCVMRLVVGGRRWLVVIVGELVVCRHLLRLLHPMWSTGPCAHAWHAQDVRQGLIA